jgi:hypothetical protein
MLGLRVELCSDVLVAHLSSPRAAVVQPAAVIQVKSRSHQRMTDDERRAIVAHELISPAVTVLVCFCEAVDELAEEQNEPWPPDGDSV